MGQGAKTFDLFAAPLAAQSPVAEVLAVVRQQPIAAFAQTRARTLHHFARIELGRIASNSDAAALCELRERNVLHRSAPQSLREAGVVNDATVADVYAVMAVERARSDEVRGDWGLFTWTKESVTRERLLDTGSDAACIVGPPVHGGRRYARARSAAIARWCRTILWNSATWSRDRPPAEICVRPTRTPALVLVACGCPWYRPTPGRHLGAIDRRFASG